MKWTFLVLCPLLFTTLIQGLDDPYKVLGIRKSSTVPEIKKAYKQLAKEWHPDKNNDPSAPDKFMEITQAYELLTDPERRRMFDNFRRVEEARPRRESHYKPYETFDDMFTGFRFKFNDRDITLFHKLSITTRAFENVLVPKSFRTPYLLLFYSDWCFPCLQMEPIWRRIIDELDPLGVGIATVHSDNEKALTTKAGVTSLPSLVLLSDGRLTSFKESLYSLQKIVGFLRNKMPYKMVPVITDETVDTFLSGWADNKIRVLVFQRTELLRLRYLITAFYHRERVAFGFVPPGPATEAVRNKYKISSDKDWFLVFNEIVDRPIASVSMLEIPINTMNEVIKANNYLLLPRLSSQTMLDALCPSGLPWARRKLCVVLVCEDTPSHDPHRQTLRKIALESHYSKERVRFMYVFQERQPKFIDSLTAGKDSPSEPLLHVAILCRRDVSHVKYEWVSSEGTWQNYNSTKHLIELAIDRFLHTAQALPNEAVIGELIDEHTQGTVARLFSKVLQIIEFLQDNLGKEHILPAVSILGTIVFVIVAAYSMNYLMIFQAKKVNESFTGSNSDISGSWKKKE